jgi:flagellar protein FliO/FliZ
MRKMQGIGVVSGQRMQVISALSVGARERVVLIQVGEKQMLLGVAPGRVNYIKELEQTLTSKDQEL